MRRQAAPFKLTPHMMFRLVMTAVAIATATAPSPGAAQGQRLCGERADMLKDLEQKYSERPQSIGLVADGGLLEVLVSPAGGWTILISYPKRPTCVVAVGRDWQDRIRLAGESV